MLERSVGVGEPPDPIATRRAAPAAAQRGERPTGEDLAVTLQGDSQHVTVRTRVVAGVDRAVSVEPADPVARGCARPAAAERRECARDQDLAVGLRGQRKDVAARARIEARVDRTVSVEPADPAAWRCAATTEQREAAAHNDLPVGLHREALDERVRARIEGRVERAVGVEAPDVAARATPQTRKVAPGQNLPVGLHREGPHATAEHAAARARVETRVNRSVGVQPPDVAAGAARQIREVATHQDLPVGLQRYDIDLAVRSRIERRIDRSVGIEPADEVARRRARAAAQHREDSANQDLSVGLHYQRENVAVRAGIEARVKRAIGVEARDIAARRSARAAATEHREPATDQDFFVALHGQRDDVAVGTRIEIRIDSAVGVEPPDVAARRRPGATAEPREEAPDEDLSIRLLRDDEHSNGAGCARVEARVDRAVSVEAADVPPRRCARPAATECREPAADQDLSIGLDRDGANLAVRSGVEAGVHRTVRVEPADVAPRRRAGPAPEAREEPGDDDLPVGLNGQLEDGVVGPRIEVHVERAVSVEPADPVPGDRARAAAAQHREAAAHEHLAVSLKGQAADLAVRARIEAGIDGAVGVEPADVAPRRRPGAAPEAGEESADENPAVWLQDQRHDPTVRARIETGVERAVGVEPTNIATHRGAGEAAAKHRELAEDQDLAVRLSHHAIDVAVRARIEARVERAICVEAANTVA